MNSINTLRPTTIETIFKRGYGKLWHVSLNRNSTTYETKLTHLTIKLDGLLINKFGFFTANFGNQQARFNNKRKGQGE